MYTRDLDPTSKSLELEIITFRQKSVSPIYLVTLDAGRLLGVLLHLCITSAVYISLDIPRFIMYRSRAHD